jgi:hypothetical protein
MRGIRLVVDGQEIGDPVLDAMHGEIEAVQNLATSGTSAKTTSDIEPHTTYSVTCNKDCYWEVGDTGDSADTSSNFLPAGQRMFFSTKSSSQYIHAIQESEAGIFGISKHTSRY